MTALIKLKTVKGKTSIESVELVEGDYVKAAEKTGGTFVTLPVLTVEKAKKEEE